MKIQIHEKAAKYFNSKVVEFLYELKPDTTKRRKRVDVESSASHVFISDHLTEKNIIEISSFMYFDQLSGKEVARYFVFDKQHIGLNESSYGAFLKLAESFYKRKEVNSFLSLDFIIDCAFDWFEKKYKGLLSADNDFVEFIVEEAEKSIKEYKVSIPISFISIQETFKIGKITFEYFRKEFFDKYINKKKSIAQESDNFNPNNFNIFERNFRKKYQGVVFASMSLEAEKRKCIEIAKSETEKGIMVLRFFSPSTFIPKIPCYFGIMGQRELPRSHVFIFRNKIPEVHESILESRKYNWHISRKKFEELKELGIEIASELIIKTNPSEFEKLILNSMSLFGRSLTFNNYQDKIVYSLVSIETFLLQTQSEPIQSSVGLRLAFIAESNREKRKDVKNLIKRAYKIRSSYIHHGRIGEDWQILENLQHLIWTAIRNALILKDRFKTQKEFLDHIEDLILT